MTFITSRDQEHKYNDTNTTFIYVLPLESGKYYVGRTTDLNRRVSEHFDGNGSSWTQKYPPIGVPVKVVVQTSLLDEETVTKEYMMSHGIQNVRGGPFSAVNISQADIEALERSLWSASDCCRRCGSPTHYVKDCKATQTVTGRAIHAGPPTASTAPAAALTAKQQVDMVRSEFNEIPVRRRFIYANPACRHSKCRLF